MSDHDITEDDSEAAPLSPLPELPPAPKLGRRFRSDGRTKSLSSADMRRHLNGVTIGRGHDESLLFSPNGVSILRGKSSHLRTNSSGSLLFDGAQETVKKYDLPIDDVQVLDRSPEKAHGAALDKIEELRRENAELKERNVLLGKKTRELQQAMEEGKKSPGRFEPSCEDIAKLADADLARDGSRGSSSQEYLALEYEKAREDKHQLQDALDDAKYEVDVLRKQIQNMRTENFFSAALGYKELMLSRGADPNFDVNELYTKYSSVVGETGQNINPWKWLQESGI